MEVANPLLELAYSIDTFYLLISGALVMWMGAGFTMLEAGLVRAKSVAGIVTKNISLYAVAGIMYWFVGYHLMYSHSDHSLIPAFNLLLGNDHSVAQVNTADGAIHYSKMAHFFFQVVFAAAAMSIVSGAVAERMKLWSFLFFAVVMTAVIYPVHGFWQWGGGFLRQAGFLDFAGAGVVHLAGATAALTGVLLLGARKGKYEKRADGGIQTKAIPGSNIPLAALGTLMLWLGWFGFNGGSALKIGDITAANMVALIFVNTNMAAAGGVIAALILSRLWFGKADITMGLNGILAGLVAITAEPLTPTPGLAIFIGAISGMLVVFAIVLIDRAFHLDDPVGAISVHGVAGIWGLLAVTLSNPAAQLITQLLGIGSIFIWVALTSMAIWSILKLSIGIRLSELEEYQGADVSEIGLEAYPEFVKK
jgi:Amt family ammonium transporter